MGQLVSLVPADRVGVPIGSMAIEALACLGVTSVSLAADSHTTAIVFEGWAFDPARSGAAIPALGGSPDDTRTLQRVVQMAVSAAASQGGTIP
ncbi:MAG: hypothetical protein M0005_13225 [Actinomycetota bacterium]|jgi:hypothetical protein|nr:hypothetical protein [Actinomycetota bacterium]